MCERFENTCRQVFVSRHLHTKTSLHLDRYRDNLLQTTLNNPRTKYLLFIKNLQEIISAGVQKVGNEGTAK